MIASLRLAGVTAATVLLAVADVAAAANTPLDQHGDIGGNLGVLDLTAAPGAGDRSNGAAPISANPLWSIPLSTLNATRERPLFLPSRRPPHPVLAAPAKPAVSPPPPPQEPERPPFRLVGIVTGAEDGFAVFVNNTTRDIIPMKTGEGYGGWILRSLKGREAVLVKDQRTVVIELPDATGGKK